VSLAFDTRLGFYEITAQIGEGGVGQVYRATAVG
jgi:serine/threonine protein kinase